MGRGTPPRTANDTQINTIVYETNVTINITTDGTEITLTCTSIWHIIANC